ncbi:MAG: TetR/AcrR family transcriptional regulator [Bacteroidota bacterium]
MPRVKLFDEREVLEKAMHLFWEKGYHATSISDLKEQLGINRSSLYDTYGDKEQLFLKTIEHYHSTNKRFIWQFLESKENVKEGIRAMFKKTIVQSSANKKRKGCFVVNAAAELLPENSHIKALVEQNRVDFEKIFFDYLQAGVEKGQIAKDKDLKAIATLLFTLNNGLQVVTKVEVKEQELLASVDALLTLLD